MSMTARQRVLAACNFDTPDRTPMDFGGTKERMTSSQESTENSSEFDSAPSKTVLAALWLPSPSAI